jgi:cation/acetate symporter
VAGGGFLRCNGMATAADWMSALRPLSASGWRSSSFCKAFGYLWHPGGWAIIFWGGLRFLFGGLLVAPYLRGMACTPCPTFCGTFCGRWPCIIAALAAVLCSFTYVVGPNLYGVGLITSGGHRGAIRDRDFAGLGRVLCVPFGDARGYLDSGGAVPHHALAF